MTLEHGYLTPDTHKWRDSEFRPRRILLIEDNKADVLLIKRMLMQTSPDNDFEFIDVPRMGDALELLEDFAVDLILLDLNLLDAEGNAAVTTIHTKAPDIPIIVYTGEKNPKSRGEALLCGAEHYLQKGFESPESLKLMIQLTLA